MMEKTFAITIKKIAVLLVFFSCARAALGGGGGGCSGSDRHDVATTNDRFGSSRICSQNTLWVDNLAYDNNEGIVKRCIRHDVGDNGCNGRYRIYRYEWLSEPISCVDGKSVDDLTLSWATYPMNWKICWQPKCKGEKEFWQGDLNKDVNDPKRINYEKCGPCRLRFIEIQDADPTEYSYIKFTIPTSNESSGCVAGAVTDNNCTGFKAAQDAQNDRETRRRTDGNSCVQKRCRCASGAPQEYKGTDDDWYVKCG
ncbi:MAG: hypothetical protein LBL21_03155 [Rickettsiales bacterium]|jgi:hypothetical protein|nr:hypothetical protein [Rickettsiales bacterium]